MTQPARAARAAWAARRDVPGVTPRTGTPRTGTAQTVVARRAAAVALLALAPLAAAACQVTTSAVPPAAQAPPAATPQAQPPGADPRACAIAPSALVGTALRLPLTRVVGTVEGPVTVCAYPGRYEVIVRFQRGENASEFAASRHATGANHQLIAAVPGLGGKAYLATYTLAKPPENTLAVRRGRLAIFVTSPAPPGAERKLMVRLLARADTGS